MNQNFLRLLRDTEINAPLNHQSPEKNKRKLKSTIDDDGTIRVLSDNNHQSPEQEGKPINKLITGIVGCVKCGAAYGKCDCWLQCKCGWLYEKNGKCNNPIHKKNSK